MVFLGIDLAGSPKNDTGVCELSVSEEKKAVKTKILHPDEEIFRAVADAKPKLIAIDAPTSEAKDGYMRACDRALRDYGALPLNLRGMRYLVERGISLRKKLEGEGHSVIEVFPTATAKILGYYDKDSQTMQKNLLNLKIEGDIGQRMLKKDELDAISCALTAFLHSTEKTKGVGGSEGTIIIPRV
jgi:hypothetical protein